MNSQSNDTLQSEDMRKLFVSCLETSTTDESLGIYFSAFGEVTEKMIITNQQTNESKGYGFVTFSNSDTIETILQTRPHVLDGKTLDVKRAMPRGSDPVAAHTKTSKLFVGGFKDTNLTTDELQQYLEARHPPSFGTFEKIEFIKDKDTDVDKGFGFITCSSPDFADRLAIAESSFTLKGKKMVIRKAESREGRQTRMYGGGRGKNYGNYWGSHGGGKSNYGYGGYGYADSYYSDANYDCYEFGNSGGWTNFNESYNKNGSVRGGARYKPY